MEILARAIRKEKEIKGTEIRKEEVKLSLFAEGMILCIENPKNNTKKLLELINKFVKFQGTKSMYKNLLHFYTLIMNYQEREIKKIILFTVASERIQYLKINLAMEVKDLYTENYKILMKEIEEDTNKWKDIPC